AAEAGDPEPRPLFLAKRGHPQRARRGLATLAEQVDRGERGHHPERAVEGATVRHRVQVAPGDHGAGPSGGIRDPWRVPPRPQVAVAVGVSAEFSFFRGLDEPATAFRVSRRPGEAPVAARAAVPANREQRLPQRGEAHAGPRPRTVMTPGPEARAWGRAPRGRGPPATPPRTPRRRGAAHPCRGRW